MSWPPQPPAGPAGRSTWSGGPAPVPRPTHGATDYGGWRSPRRHRRGAVVVEVLGVAIGAVGLLWVLGQVVLMGGPEVTAVAAALAVLPLVGVLATIAWVDRWEPEPRGLLLAALLWGAGVATGVSIVLNDTFSMVVYTATGSTDAATFLSAVVSAPVVEESAKGVGLLLIFLLRRRFFDGPVDGIVYAGTVAAGFAFVENVLYFVQYSDTVLQTFVVRGVQSPFAHLLFTACMGLALGVAARSRNRGAWVGLLPLGWLAAVLLHALWNGSAAFGVHSVVYVVFQVPFFVGVVVLVVWLRSRERAVIARQLREYASAGWFVPHEVEMLTSLPARRAARSWARDRGAGREMRDFQRAAVELALYRERAVNGRAHLRGRADEQRLLGVVTTARAAFAGAGRG
ncbi:PrsW family intramembrane metalloprotease [Georgenia sp. 10Sc9-8]|uniref:PrsW family intramembrane metalloprotease n=1 Tax=Georgenia halotolerans TaxID=3028317 RepID=A0ABT5TU66_9MICO|nr:PrsW family intramembrane metalloprotease [Georgenia halotolerans]